MLNNKMTTLSVNINKIALLRNSRGNNFPDLIKTVINIHKFGGQGITLHPRPDERHIKYEDIYKIKNVIKTELNIEGNPSERFIKMIIDIKPDQVTLVPDKKSDITSNYGWNVILHKNFLTEIINEFKRFNIRTSIFLNPDPKQIKYVHQTGADCIEMHTGLFANSYKEKRNDIIKKYINTAKIAIDAGLKINAGHDLNLKNIFFYIKNIPETREVSIGHALIIESIYFGLENTIKLYLKKIKMAHKKRTSSFYDTYI